MLALGAKGCCSAGHGRTRWQAAGKRLPVQTRRSDDESERCNASSRRVRPGASFPPTPRSTIPSISSVTSSPGRQCASFEPQPWRIGIPRQSLQHYIPFGSASRLGEVNVTIPCWLHLALNAKRKRVCIGLTAPIKEMTLNDSVWHVWAMWLSVHLPRLDSTCASGRLARLHASIGSHLAAGDAFADVTIDLSAGVMRDCPPVTTCRIVLQEPAWLRRLLISPTEPVAGGGLIALFSITPDSPPEDPSRHARANLAMILHHEDWWESER